MENKIFDCGNGNRLKKDKSEKREKVSSDSDSSEISIDEELKRKLYKKLKKLKKKKKEKKCKKDKGKDNKRRKRGKERNEIVADKESEKSKNLAPMTKEEWEKQQNTLRRVYDEETGRTRLVKGTGEIVEECVSKERQTAINKQATLKDGEYFQKILSLNIK